MSEGIHPHLIKNGGGCPGNFYQFYEHESMSFFAPFVLFEGMVQINFGSGGSRKTPEKFLSSYTPSEKEIVPL